MVTYLCLQLSTSRALFNKVTVRCEWDLSPQLLDLKADMLTTTLTIPSSLDVSLNVNIVGSSTIHDVL